MPFCCKSIKNLLSNENWYLHKSGNMKKLKHIFLIIIIMAIVIACSVFKKQSDADSKPESELQDIYKDGSYVGVSRALYISEPFWGKVYLTIENGSFTSISFVIRDSSLHETFTDEYKKHYQGNPVYLQQVINDWQGIQTYPKKLLRKQNPGKVDCISGATWSYNIFQAALEEALKNAKR